MPSFAPYGNAIYGETAYGYPPSPHVQTTMSVSPPPSTGIGLYNSLLVNWITPGGNWNELILVRSSFGVPISPFTNDGVTLIDQTSNFSTNFQDVGLVSGRFYYYSLFVFDTDIDTWLLSSSAQGLCLTDFQFPQIFTSWTPDWYMEQDQLLVPSSPLERFFGLLGFEENWVRSEIESLYLLNSPEYISGAVLPFLGGNVGMTYEPALGMNQSRVLVSSAAQLYKTKGTSEGVQGAASAYTGYGCELTLSPNVEIQLDDATFDRSVGHWVPQNSGTSISAVPASQFGITPQHVSYLPIQGNAPLSGALMLENNIEGYIPANNENVGLLTASSAFNWTQQTQNFAIPPSTYGAAFAYDASSGQTVMFGGIPAQGDNNQITNQTWVFNGTYWKQAFPATSPPARKAAAMAYDAASSTIIMFGGSGGASGTVLLNDTWSWNGTTWTKLTSTHTPPNRSFHGMATWSSTGVILFGGSAAAGAVNDTWLWNGTDWLVQSPGTKPSARYNHAMVYDSFEQATPGTGNGVIVLFGGYTGSAYLNDTWTWTGTNWVVQSPSHVPAVRGAHTLAFDILNDTVVMFGGTSNPSSSFLSDTWTWGGTDWKQITNSANTPPGRFQHMSAYSATGKVVIFSGQTSAGASDDTWLWNGTNWIQIEGGQTPQARAGAAMTYNTNTGKVFMFGGFSSQGVYNSTWTWDNINGWVQLQPINSPPPLDNAGMAYTTGSNVILFGGNNSFGSATGQTWSWNGTTWSLVTTTGSPPARSGQAFDYDQTNSKIIMFGGFISGGIASDTWTYNVGATTWTSQSPSTPPPATVYGAMVYTTGGLSVMFGGQTTGGGYLNTTWQYNGSTNQWSQLAPAVSPPARTQHVAIYDTALSSIFVFGGSGPVGVNFTDSWEYTSSNWQSVNFGTPNPWPRTNAAATYFPTTQSLIVFGGVERSNFQLDTWLGNVQASGINISECDTTNANTLGIPITFTPAQTVVAPVQKGDTGGSFTNSGSAGTLSFGSNPTVGNTLFLVIGTNHAVLNDIQTISSPICQSFTRISSIGGTNAAEVWMGTITSSSSKALTCTLGSGAGAGWNAAAYELKGVYNATSVGSSTANPAQPTNSTTFNGLEGLIGAQILISIASISSGALTPPGGSWVDYNGSGLVWNASHGGDFAYFLNQAGPTGVTSTTATWGTPGGGTYWLMGVVLTPIVAPPVVLSGYFRPSTSAGTLESFIAQLDWYGATGGLISSTAGTPTIESASAWTRVSVVGTPPAGAAFFGRTFKTSSTNMLGDLHLMDAVQTEFNTLATPGPTSWTPPRDLWLNLLPAQRNLIVNGQALASTFGWSAPSGGTLTVAGAGPSWPQGVSGGFQITSFTGGGNLQITVQTANMPVSPGEIYSGSVFFQSTSGTTPLTWTVNVIWVAANGSTQISTSSSAAIAVPHSANFFQLTINNVTAPTTAQFAIFQVHGTTPGGGSDTFVFGAPIFGPGSQLTYFDGNLSPSPDYSFEGTPNESISDYYPNITSRLSRLVTVMPLYTPIGSTFSIYTHQYAVANAGLR